MSPFKALYGYPPPSHHTLVSNLRTEVVKTKLLDVDHVLTTLKNNLASARNRMKQIADQHRSDRSFHIGDMVFLCLQPYKQQSLRHHSNQKLNPRFYGPYCITQRIREVAYALDLPPSTNIYNVFHVSCLKKKLRQSSSPQTTLSLLIEE